MFGRNCFDGSYTRLDDQPAVARHFIATSSQQLARPDPVMSQKSVDAVRVFIPRAVVMKRERAVQIASEEKRCGQACRPGADNNAVV